MISRLHGVDRFVSVWLPRSEVIAHSRAESHSSFFVVVVAVQRRLLMEPCPGIAVVPDLLTECQSVPSVGQISQFLA